MTPTSSRDSDRHRCYLADMGVYERGDMPPCDGQLIRAHLIPRHQIRKAVRREFAYLDERRLAKAIEDYVTDPRSWVPACGGPQGNGGHHGMLDQSRTLRLARADLPGGLERFAHELGLVWWLDREYGDRA